MIDGVSVVSGERVFRRHPARAVVSAILISAALSAATLFILPQFLPRRMDLSTRGMIVLAVAIALTLVVFVSVLWLRNTRIVVRADTVEVGRAGNREVYDRATTAFRSKITEHRTNGLRSGITRALIIENAGREITVELPGFTRATFNDLMATLNPIAPPAAADPVAAARERAQLPSSFTVDSTGERRLANGLTIGAVMLLVVAAAVVVLALQPGFLDGELSALVLLVPFAGLAGIVLAIVAFQRRRVLKAIPAHITVSHHGLRLDDVDLPFSQLTRIWLTPPAYPVRRIRFERVSGRATVHVLGSSRVQMTPEYTALLLALRAETAQHPEMLRLDLE
ncbi:hypothetical protein [Microbacterium foliorum]|uniref:hypothetical protein n=1 Tax=Microbacterium foliorum TaxID=104336 RepID=UPI001E0AE064|nr:hypothetical protein [Microbacterium foliorum]CAH0234604.1 hypothetical protein SRABI03_02804 [Microbacterium foliorum]CAH0246874.1 hypothetical protein SRABI44_03057 [Microbacterium foliorum]